MRYINWKAVILYLLAFSVTGLGVAYFVGFFERGQSAEVVRQGVEEAVGLGRVDLSFRPPQDAKTTSIFTNPSDGRVRMTVLPTTVNGESVDDLLITEDYTRNLTGGVFPLPGQDEVIASVGEIALRLLPSNTEYFWLNGIQASGFSEDTFTHALMRQLQYSHREAAEVSLISYGIINVSPDQSGAYVMYAFDHHKGQSRMLYYLRKGDVVVQGDVNFPGDEIPQWVTEVTIAE